MRHLKTTLAVLGAATILVLAGNTISLAATGHAFILGKANTASTITKLTRTTNGPALRLVTKNASNAPLSTNAHGKVSNLNADMLDGLDSSTFARASSQPIARGFVNTGLNGTAPTLATGSTGVSAVTWDSGFSRYVLTVTGQAYYYNKYVTLITGTCDGNLAAITSSVSNNLLVQFGTGTACSPGGFAYVIYKIS